MTEIRNTNFLQRNSHTQNTEEKPKKRRIRLSQKRKKLGIIGAVMAVLLGGLLVIDYADAKSAYGNAMDGKTSLELAYTALIEQDFDQASQYLTTSHDAFQDSQEALGKIGAARYIPFASRQVTAVNYILDSGIQLTSAALLFTTLGTEAMDVIEESDTISFANISQEQKAEVLRVFYESPPELQGALAQVKLAEQSINNIPTFGLLPPIDDAADLLREQFPIVQSGIEQAVPAIKALPFIAGYPDERTYLFLLQNNSELRPSGGFIGTYGILKVKNGEIATFETDNIYNLDNTGRNHVFVDPPEPITKYLGSSQWLMRDSNWDPDFPTSAQQALWFYLEESRSKEEIDGVVAITPVFIQSLLEVTGEVTIHNITFTPDNLVVTLQRIVEQDYTAYGLNDSTRKQIIGELADELMNRILALPQDQWGTLWEVFQKDITSKHILMYTNNETIEELIQEQGWGGEIQSNTGDYLMVVDANLASLKSDPLVFRTHNYSVTNDPEHGLVAKLDITYNNKNDLTFFTTRYHTYVRVYVPEGSMLLSVDGAEDEVVTTTEHGKTIFGTYKTIEFQDQEVLTLTYALPNALEEQLDSGEYDLLIQKQPGTTSYDLGIRFDVGEKIKTFDPQIIGTLEGSNAVQFSTVLDSDRRFVIGLDS